MLFKATLFHITAVFMICYFYHPHLVHANCATSKSARTTQHGKLNHGMNEDDVVIEAKYKEKVFGIFKFRVMQSWEKYNGDLQFRDEILVKTDSSSNEFTQNCFDGLEKGSKVFLILSKQAEKQFVATTPPVLSRKQSHRVLIRKIACPDCPGIRITRESFPSTITEYRGISMILECRVDSGSSLTRLDWFKDGQDILKGGESYRTNGLDIKNANLRAGIGELVITRATSMLTGNYKCVAENEDGETAELTTVLTITPDSNKPCPPEDNHYCFNQGICRLNGRSGQEVKSCMCKTGYRGERCGQTILSMSVSGIDKNNNNTLQTINEMKVVMAILGSALIVTFLVASGFVIAYIQLKRSSTRYAPGIETKMVSNDA